MLFRNESGQMGAGVRLMAAHPLDGGEIDAGTFFDERTDMHLKAHLQLWSMVCKRWVLAKLLR